jgi:hypothetical protein
MLLRFPYNPIRRITTHKAILGAAMRRFIPILLVLLLALPATAWAMRSLPGDGTLVVDNGRGQATIRARGGIIGRFDSGRLIVEEVASGGNGPVVYGAERIRDLGLHRTLYVGEDVRFRMIGGLYRVTIQAVGMDVSAAGRGTAVLDATGFTDLPGRFSINGGPFQPLPGRPTTYQLGQPPPPGQIGK